MTAAGGVLCADALFVITFGGAGALVPFVAVTVLLLVLAVAVDDLAAVYGRFRERGGFAILLLMFLTSVSVVVFIQRRRDIADASLWHRSLASTLAPSAWGRCCGRQSPTSRR
ncbi:hypothetical protein ACFWJ5_09445 [Streptomyces qaidamensis]|uniref:hypothetical protein n=1 Tax=Streptomyces qaidamensis TaxID=1783515 RepID=UPI003659DF92